MESIIIIYFCLLLLTFVSNGVGENPLVGTLNKMARKGKLIKDILKPLPNGVIRDEPSTLIYKGMLLSINKEVAMTFRIAFAFKREYDMYTYLNAINKPEVEANGVPTIYYYCEWEKQTVLAMTLLSPEFNQYLRHQNFHRIDFLILFREYVRISKYIHGRGVFLIENELSHMMFHKDQGFIYDLVLANKLTKGTSRQDKLSAARADWKRFLHDIFSFMKAGKLHQRWLGLERMEDPDSFAVDLIADSTTNERHSGLKRVLIEFAKRVYCKDSANATSFYDQLYEVIVEELGKTNPALPSWLSRKDKRAATLAPFAIPSISNLRDPFASDEPVYDKVNYDIFYKIYKDYYDEFYREQFRKYHPDQGSSSGA